MDEYCRKHDFTPSVGGFPYCPSCRIAALEKECDDADFMEARIATLETAMKNACGFLVNFIILADPQQEEAVDDFLVRWTEFSGVTSNKGSTPSGEVNHGTK